jgi:hypothetical protein
MITQSTLKKNLHYAPETGIFTWLKNKSQRVKIGAIAGNLQQTGYARIEIDGITYRSHRLAWLYCYGQTPEFFIDHIDGNKNNNRLENLRECTNSENMKNQGVRVTNTSGYKGVSWHKRDCKWAAFARINGRLKHLGYFETPKAASIAYNEFAKINHGAFYKDTTITKILKG